ncbi:uncharacterized protein LOC125858958 [Solanum stenotomum]|uniref:uncharacterized protein LOC125858958 n=1 Tax=Solanum stenotomum TaxID=172797 RepID=UPI0020D0CB12|nr:uncharacterized protein LOC125858958 [Solanum stenotomum]
MNQERQGELGLGISGNFDDDNQNNVNNPENVNNPRNPNNEGGPPVVPARPVRDVAVPLTANLASRNQGYEGEMSRNSTQKVAEILDVHQATDINAKLDAMQHNITLQFKQIALNQASRGGVQQNYGNTYNPSWKNHPNFSWGGNQNQNQTQGVNQYRSQGAGQQYYNPNQSSNTSAQKGGMTNEELLQKLTTEIGTKLNARIDKQDENIRNIHMPQMSLEKQVVQVANSLNLRPQGGLPGDTEPNPKQLHEGILKYAKFMKDIVASKRRLTEYETVALTEECSSRIQNRLPKKLKDPGSFTVQITIGQSVHARGLCDFGASINLMPLSLYLKLGLGSPKRTTVILQHADRSIARPKGVVEDVLVQVGSLIFSVDFVVLDFEPDPEVPFILGRPFLATGKALIDIAAGQLTMRAHDKVEVFDVYRALKLPSIYEELSAITVVDRLVEAHSVVPDDPL